MAFLGRGKAPSVGVNNGGFYRRWRYYRRCYYIPLDNTYVIMQMIVTFIILIVGAITYITTYKSNIVDPIESTKKLFINTHMITIGVFLILTLIINFFTKKQKGKEVKIVNRLIVIGIISIITMFVFAGIKFNLDNTYTKSKFEQIYNEQNNNQNNNKKSVIDMGITGAVVKTEKQYYIDEYVKLYNIFKTKSYGTLSLHLLLNILLIYQILRLEKIGNKKERVNKDDLILFDEEENIKF